MTCRLRGVVVVLAPDLTFSCGLVVSQFLNVSNEAGESSCASTDW